MCLRACLEAWRRRRQRATYTGLGGPEALAVGASTAQLHLACWHGNLEVARGLVQRGANTEAGDEHGRTPLHLACVNGRLGVVRCLVERGADKDKATPEGGTPLC